MSKVLIISGHPELDQSQSNRLIINDVLEHIDEVECRRLDVIYPDYRIDVTAEQTALIDADIIVFQFPFHWYSVPALMKKWIDEVLTYNFAYGSKGDKLKGKHLILSFTIGAAEGAYQPLGHNHFTIENLIQPLQQLAYLTQMNYIKPIYTHQMAYSGGQNALDTIRERAKEHAQRLIAQIRQLQ